MQRATKPVLNSLANFISISRTSVPYNPIHQRPRRIHVHIYFRAMATSPNHREHIQALSKYTACDVADALLRLKVPNAGYLPDLHLITPMPSRSPSSGAARITIAPASTALFASKSASEADIARLPEANIEKGKHWVDLTAQGTILCMAQAEGQKCAVLGGIMALRIKTLGAKGVVVSGRVRDIEELSETGLPIWAKATSIVGSGAEVKPHALQVRLDIGGTVINPGDLVFSDATNGVVVIPIDKVQETITLLPKLVQADDRVKEDVLKGMSVQEAFKKHRG